jgi:hypothetical protein
MEDKIEEIYRLSVDLYYEVADDNMLKRGHPGVMGQSSTDESFNKKYCVLMGAIKTLEDVSNKIKTDAQK